MLLAFVLVRSQTTDKGNEDNEDEDYQPVENQKITYLDDSNFEEITHVSKMNTSESWFIFFDNKDASSDIIREEVEKLVEKSRLGSVKVGMVDMRNSPNTVHRFNVNPSYFSIIYFKASKDLHGNSTGKMYLFDGPKGHENMKHYITKGYKLGSKDILAVPPPITFYERIKRQAASFLSNITRQFDGAFHSLGYGHLSVFAKILILYLIIAVGVLIVVIITVAFLKKIEQKFKGKKSDKYSDEDSEIEQEEQDIDNTVVRRKK